MSPSNPHTRKNPIHHNLGFKCAKCGKENPPAEKSCRNHCKYCLYSQHVDLNTPGDRLSTCGGLMEPISITYKGNKGNQIVHQCIKCSAQAVNKVADDDDLDLITEIMKRQNTDFTKP